MYQQTSILIVEDDGVLAQGLKRALKTEEREIKICGKLREVREILRDGLPDLMILDVNLPDGNGFDFLEEVKRQWRFPVILLTANDMETDIVAGLEAGADDYITKPFSLAVLRARVNTQLRRMRENGEKQETAWVYGRYRFCFDRMEYSVDGKQVELSKNEQKLLRILVENEGRILKRETLIDRLWTDGAEYVDENALSVTVKRLRNKLDAGAQIETVYGSGYRWVKRHG
ncbi:MAG TPA: response regulator transcription factor [Candidatus Blautia excrementigallinarum]|nr:response regulator transcription factor [Candidatus Blautia excrementigallinarum]